jgi:hypothetical protein
VATIQVPEKEGMVFEEKGTPYEPPLPFPEAKRIHEERYEAKLHARLLEEEEALPKTYHDKKEQRNQELPKGITKLNEEATKAVTGKTEGRGFGRPVLPCSFERTYYYGLCNLVSSINVIPYELYLEIKK